MITSCPATCEMRWICQKKKKIEVVSLLMSGFWRMTQEFQGYPRMVFHFWFGSFYRNFSAVGRSTGNSFSSSWDIGSQHWNGLSRRGMRGVPHGVLGTRVSWLQEFRLHIGYETPDEEAMRLLKLTVETKVHSWKWNGQKFKTVDEIHSQDWDV